MENKTKMSPPWVIYYKKLAAMFEEDPEVTVAFNEDKRTIYLYVDGNTKADALDKLLPDAVNFGNVTVPIVIVPANENDDDFVVLLDEAFDGNPALDGISIASGPMGRFVYAVWRKKPVQFFADNLGDVNGNMTLLMADVAREIFDGNKGVYHCTSASD